MQPLNAKFSDCALGLYGGSTVVISGELTVPPPRIATVTGATGSGKTMLLAVLAHFTGNPAFRAIKRVQREKIEIVSDSIHPQHIGIVRQNPSDNFLGRSVGEEIELAFNISRLSRSDFKQRLEYYWGQYFDFGLALLSKPPSKLSSGQQQILGVLTQVLRQPDLLLADEPIARLSSANAKRIIDLLAEVGRKAYVVASTHGDALHIFMASSDGCSHHVVEENGGRIHVASAELLDPEEPLALSAEEATEILVNWDSYSAEASASEDFRNLPSNTVRVISGNGAMLAQKGLDIDVFTSRGGSPSVTVRSMLLAKGINLVYGDNGAGKTLLGRALAGDMPLNPWVPFFRDIYANGAHAELSAQALGPTVPGGAGLGWLQRTHRCHFLSSNPEESVGSGRTVEEEIRAIYGTPADIATRLTFLENLGVTRDREIDTLSFGQKKLLSFSLLRDEYSLIILDELFANLSREAQLAVGCIVMERAKSGRWSVVVLTSNRPRSTLGVLRQVTLSDTAAGQNQHG